MMSFKSLLFDTGTLTKSAGPDSQSKQQLEQDFGKLAYTFFKDRAPQLLNYLLGFEIVDQEEDGSKAIGIFGCKIGDGYYYIPVFFVHGQIKGMDLLYNKHNNVFLPLQETWINYILDKQTVKLGDSTTNNTELRKDFESPNFRFLQYPYQYYKTAGEKGATAKVSTKTPTSFEISKDGFAAWNAMQVKIAKMLRNDAEMQAAWAGAFIKLEDRNAVLAKSAKASPLIDFLVNHGGPAAVSTLANSLDDFRFAKAAVAFYPSISDILPRVFTCLPEKTAEKVKIITQETNYGDIGQEDRKRIVRDGFTVKDIREPKEKSEMFATDYTRRFHTPDEPGLYDLLLETGGIVEAWVLGPSRPLGRHMVIVEPTKMFAIMAEPRCVIVREDRKDTRGSLFSKAIALDKVQPGTKYILINDKLNTSDIFCVNTVRDSNTMRTEYDVSFCCDSYDAKQGAGTWDNIKERRESPDYMVVDVIQIAGTPGDKLRVAGNKLIVPANWKALEVVHNPFNDDESAYKALKPGTMADLDEALFKSALHKLVVESADKGLEYIIRFDDFQDGPYNRKTAAIRLVRDYGFDFDDVVTTLDEASVNIKSRRLCKLAQVNGVGVAMPPPAPQYYGSDPYNGQMVQGPDEQLVSGQFTGVPPLQDPMRYGFNLGGETQSNIDKGKSVETLQNEIINLSGQAEASGQKSIFDHSTIAGLSQIYDVSSVLDTYLPEMLKSLDRLGRILFIFYWKNSEFVDRYGDDGINDMEDLLRNVFKSFGDLILKLKQKAISSNMDTLI